jgi:peptidoglycan/LPS O-acetylase OafA/YrhL
MLKNFHHSTYARVLALGNYLLVAACVALAVLLNILCTESLASGALITVTGFSLLSISFALLVLAALSGQSILGVLRVPGAQSLALWSYAIYLAHKPVYKLMLVPLHQMEADVNGLFSIVTVLLAGVASGWILYRGVEMPFMKLRSRLFAGQP